MNYVFLLFFFNSLLLLFVIIENPPHKTDTPDKDIDTGNKNIVGKVEIPTIADKDKILQSKISVTQSGVYFFILFW